MDIVGTFTSDPQLSNVTPWCIIWVY